MVDGEVLKYIRNALAQGQTRDQITEQLMENGVSKSDAEQAIASMQTPAPALSAAKRQYRTLLIALVFLAIIALVSATIAIYSVFQ